MTHFIAPIKFVMELAEITRRGSVYQGRERTLLAIVPNTS